MPQSVSIGLGAILDSTDVNHQPLSSTNLQVVSAVFRVHLAVTASVQIITDGNSTVDWAFEVTNLNANFSRAVNNKILGNVFNRDDSYGSNMWSTISSGVLAKNPGVIQSTIATLGACAHVDARIILQWDPANTAGTTANYFACARVSGT